MKRKIKFTLISLFILIIVLTIGIFVINKIYNNGDNQIVKVGNLQEDGIKIITLNKKDQPEEILNSSVCPTPEQEDEEEYEDMSLLNIGQEVGLSDSTYIPKDLRELNMESSTKKGICLTKETADAFLSMVSAGKDDKKSIKASSGFRSYEYQKNLLTNAIKSGQKDASVSIAKAGYSEHQLGTAIDITGASINYDSASGSFDKTPEDLWLKENAYLYGFIQSYPKNKDDITGYKYEPWHYRYIGILNAKEIKDSGLTITEFLK